MPYDKLPQRYRDLIPAEAGQAIFRNVINSQLADGKSEEVAFASAWAALQRAGYEKDGEGKWVKKTQPTMSQVHVPGAEDGDDGLEKALYQGRQVTLDKPFRLPAGSSRKFGVYVKAGDRVKRVTFGDPNMEIRRDDPQARANFRARHSCDTATDKTTARYWSCRMWTAGMTVSEATKSQMSDEDDEHDDESDMEDSENAQPGPESRSGLLERTVSAIVQTIMDHEVTKSANVIKLDSERRIAWGWASVSTMKGELVTDLQGDTITPPEMEKMADRFMASARTAKAMHDGDGIGEVLHSLPLTADLAKALGIAADREGWIIGMKIKDDAVWAGFKDGTYKAFSIGGKSRRRPK